ncbi:MAG TPA: hypothetical protein VFG68_23870 [Fimbriiglobus sp.]|nr:hypothetical protein [Fimbriiglobus sp.]
MRVFGYLAVLVAAAGLAGCGGGTNKKAVSGTVTWKSQPLATGMIRFLPVEAGGQTETGAVITDGKFDIPKEQGLLPGKYKVAISSPDPKSGQGPADAAPGERGGYPATERIAAKYNSKTVLTADVTADGKNHFEFQVE